MTTPDPVPRISGVELAGNAELPLLIVGPSLGTGVATLWGPTAALLGTTFHVVGWNLPGHGSVVGAPFSMADLAAGVRRFTDGVRAARSTQRRGAATEPTTVAGDSVGGAVSLQWALDAPEEVQALALLCTGAQIGEPQAWLDRASSVRASGTPSMVSGSAERWFGPGFLDREPQLGAALLGDLQHADAEGYAQICEALAGFDLRDRLSELTVPLLAIAGSADTPTPPTSLAAIVTGAGHGRLEVLAGVAHLAPAEAPGNVATLLGTLAVQPSPEAGHLTRSELYDAGMKVRREVLGDAHVDRASAAVTELTDDFQELITRYAWGEIWTRPGLTRKERSVGVLTALIARGHHEELAMHVRSAITNGLTVAEIKEVILQSAIYCGVPDANTAFRVAQVTLSELGLISPPGTTSPQT